MARPTMTMSAPVFTPISARLLEVRIRADRLELHLPLQHLGVDEGEPGLLHPVHEGVLHHAQVGGVPAALPPAGGLGGVDGLLGDEHEDPRHAGAPVGDAERHEVLVELRLGDLAAELRHPGVPVLLVLEDLELADVADRVGVDLVGEQLRLVGLGRRGDDGARDLLDAVAQGVVLGLLLRGEDVARDGGLTDGLGGLDLVLGAGHRDERGEGEGDGDGAVHVGAP